MAGQVAGVSQGIECRRVFDSEVEDMLDEECIGLQTLADLPGRGSSWRQ